MMFIMDRRCTLRPISEIRKVDGNEGPDGTFRCTTRNGEDFYITERDYFFILHQGPIIPALPGYRMVYWNKKAREPWVDHPIVGWMCSDTETTPICDDSGVPTNEDYAIQRPDGTVFIPGRCEYADIAALKADLQKPVPKVN